MSPQELTGLVQLAWARLDDLDAAQHVVQAVWAEAQRARKSADQQWLYVSVRRAAPRRQPAASGEPFWQAVAALDDDEHLLLMLLYLHDWPTAQAAKLLRVGPGPAQAQQRLFRQNLARLPAHAPGADPDEVLRTALQTRYPAASAAERAAIIASATPAPISDATQPASDSPLPAAPAADESVAGTSVLSALGAWLSQRQTLLLRAGGLGLLLLTVIALTALAGWWAVQATAPAATPAAANLRGAPTPITPAPQVAALTRYAGRDEIIRRWQDSPALWHTLALTVQHVDYGPAVYYGPPQRSLFQVWLSQPGEAVVLSGPMALSPHRSLLTASGVQVTRNLLTQQSTRQRWDGYSLSLLPDGPLSAIVYPLSTPWASQPGEFRPVQTVSYLERSTLVMDWINAAGERQARLWLDAATGLLLRVQTYGGPDSASLLSESAVTALALDAAAPSPALSAAARNTDLSGAQDFQAIQPSPTPAMPLAVRPSLPLDRLPAGVARAGLTLSFQFAGEPGALDGYLSDDLQPFDLFGSGYWLGRTHLPLPWGLICRRAPGGQYLAFFAPPEGSPFGALRWLDLDKPDQVVFAGGRLQVSALAFHPHGRYLAAFGFGADQPLGVYQVDLITGQAQLLLPADAVQALLYSPDGESLAIDATLPDQPQAQHMVLHIDTAQFSYQSPPALPLDEAYTQSPVRQWGLIYPPLPAGGLEACAQP